MLHHVLFGCSIWSLPHICGKMRKVWCAQSTKEKEESRRTYAPSLFSGTARCVVGNPRGHAGSLTWTTSGWSRSRRGLTICTIRLNRSCGVGQGSGSIRARHMSGTDPAGSPQLATSCRGEPKCWTRVWTGSEIPSIQQGMKVLGCFLGLRGFRAGAVGGHHRETQCIVTSNPERARHPVSMVVVAPLRFGTSKLPTQGVET